jgi:mono/diheme cytochrome c family protein
VLGHRGRRAAPDTSWTRGLDARTVWRFDHALDRRVAIGPDVIAAAARRGMLLSVNVRLSQRPPVDCQISQLVRDRRAALSSRRGAWHSLGLGSPAQGPGRCVACHGVASSQPGRRPYGPARTVTCTAVRSWVALASRLNEGGRSFFALCLRVGGAGAVLGVSPTSAMRGVSARAARRVGPPYRGLRH